MDKLTTRALQAQVEAAVRLCIDVKMLCRYTDFTYRMLTERTVTR